MTSPSSGKPAKPATGVGAAPEISITVDGVEIDGYVLPRKRGCSPSQWFEFWERVRNVSDGLRAV